MGWQATGIPIGHLFCRLGSVKSTVSFDHLAIYIFTTKKRPNQPFVHQF